jgi:uncharacterized protein YegL
MKKVALREVAHIRAGEKIDLLNIGIIAYRAEDYPILKQQLTAERLSALYAPISYGTTVRYELPNVNALNFVFNGILSGGRTRTLAFEESGRNLACLLFSEELEVPDDYVTRSEYIKSLHTA